MNSNYDSFIYYCENVYLKKTLNESFIPPFLKKYFDFIKELANSAKLKVQDVLKMFMNKNVFGFFNKIKWNISNLFDLIKKGFKAYNEILNAIAEYVSKTKVGKWTEDKLKDLDNFLQKHPRLKKIGGVIVAGLLIYIWFNMTFTGDFSYDFDLTDALAALSGKFTLSNLFAGTQGTKLLMLFATGIIGISFPWPGPTSIYILIFIICGFISLK